MLIPLKDRISFTSRYQTFIRETGKNIPYERYLFLYEFTTQDMANYRPLFSAFVRKRNQTSKMLGKDSYPANVAKVMKQQIALKHLPEEYLVFLREYPKKK